MFGQHELLCRCCNTKSMSNRSFSLSALFFSSYKPLHFPIPTPPSSLSQPSCLKNDCGRWLAMIWPCWGAIGCWGFGVFAFWREAVSIDVLQGEGGKEGGNGKGKEKGGIEKKNRRKEPLILLYVWAWQFLWKGLQKSGLVGKQTMVDISPRHHWLLEERYWIFKHRMTESCTAPKGEQIWQWSFFSNLNLKGRILELENQGRQHCHLWVWLWNKR